MKKLTVAQIIDQFPSLADFGQICGFEKNPEQRASDMKRRDSIPSRYWSSIVDGANKIGIKIDYKTLAEAHEERASA